MQKVWAKNYQECTTSGVREAIYQLREYRPAWRVFFVIFLQPWRIFEYKESLNQLRQGYDSIFFVPSESLKSPYVWDIVMYDAFSYQPIVCLHFEDKE